MFKKIGIYIFIPIVTILAVTTNAETVKAMNWPVNVGSSYTDRPYRMVSNPISNEIFICYDYSGSKAIIGLNSSGTKFLDQPKEPQELELCPSYQPTNNIGSDGQTYGINNLTSGSSNQKSVVAYQGSTKLWETPITSPCSANSYSVSGPHIGKDGKLYIFHDHNCSGRKVFLTQLNSSDGTHVATTLASNEQITTNPVKQSADGLFFKSGLGEVTFKFYPFNDIANPTSLTLSPLPGEDLSDTWEVSPSGRINIAAYGHHTNCGSSYIITRVISLEDDQEMSHDLTGECIVVSPSSMNISPDNIVITGRSHIQTPTVNNDDKIIIINDSGLHTITAREPANAYRTYPFKKVITALNGNFIVSRPYDIRPSSITYKHEELFLYNAQGELLKRFTTEAYGPSKNHSISQMVLANNNLYTIIETNSEYSTHKIHFSLLDNEYPRAELLSIEPSDIKPLKYVAMGDSFSSGEGVEPFIEGTAVPGTNECHRSEHAYSRILAESLSSPLTMRDTDFVACSGATMTNITTVGQHSEPPQIQALTNEVDVVSLTIGGNDINFGGAIRTCVTQDESACRSARDSTRSELNTQHTSNLTFVLEEIEERITTNTKVYVLGYPAIFPPSYSGTVGECRWGPFPGLTSGRLVTEEELTDINAMTATLNNLTKAAVDSIGDNFIYRDVSEEFAGHEVCTEDPWFHGTVVHISPSVQVYSFHPNRRGQEAYASTLMW